MLGTCECGKVMSDSAEKCPGCGGENPYYKRRGKHKLTRGVCDVLWVLCLLATLGTFVSFLGMLGRAENIMQQIFACADALAWTVGAYVVVRCITSALRP